MQNSVYLGKQIGNYRVTNVLASGSFGTVFLAHHLYLKQRFVVIKFLHAVRLGSEEEKERFLQEAQFLEMLRGIPFILPLLDVGVESETDIPYLITEYAERGSLRRRLNEYPFGQFPLNEALKILLQVGQGLQAAHDLKIVHRDLKPENILFNAKGDALLADFGISTALESTSIKVTDIIGTPAYMAPEQFRGEVSKESDQYGLACIAYELFTGLKPFNAKDIVALGFMHTSEEPIPPREHNLAIPEHVEGAILRAMAKQRADRFPNVAAFVEALQQQARARTGRSNTRPLGPNEGDEANEIPPTIVATPAASAGVPPTLLASPPASSTSGAPHSAAVPKRQQQERVDVSPPPLYLPGPSDAGREVLSTPMPPPPPPPFAYGPQPISTPPAPRPISGQSVYEAPAGARQAQVYMSPPQAGRYTIPESVLAAQPVTFGRRMLAIAFYLIPILSWIFYFRLTYKTRFIRFHLMQALSAWIGWVVYARLIEETKASEGLHALLNLGAIFFLVILVVSIVAALLGKNYPVPLFGQLAQRFANRAHAPKKS